MPGVVEWTGVGQSVSDGPFVAARQPAVGALGGGRQRSGCAAMLFVGAQGSGQCIYHLSVELMAVSCCAVRATRARMRSRSSAARR